MTGLRLSIRSALFYWRNHLSIMAGTALACAVLTGAMLVGDSVRYSLREFALLRLGRIHFAMDLHNRFFQATLADRMESEAKTAMAPVLFLRGVAISLDESGNDAGQVNNVQVLGVDNRFWSLGTGKGVRLDDGIAVNAKLAEKLRIKTGDEVSLRMAKPSLLSRDAPLSSRKGDETIRGTFTVVGIMGDADLGRFSLTASQVVPYNVFVSLKWLQANLSLADKANLLLVSGQNKLSAERLNELVVKTWRISDAGLFIREFEDRGLFQLESERIFLEPAVSRAALEMHQSVGSLTYLVNSISRQSDYGSLSTPYSFAEALSPLMNIRESIVPEGMKDDEVVINRWAADCLSVRTGETVTVSYYELTPLNKFVEKSSDFKVRRILEMREVAGERQLGPRFPGLTDADRCGDWDIGMPMDKDKVEDKPNETYWKAYGATPKIYVTLKAGREMWANRFGDLTAVRFPADRCGKDLIAETLLNKINPSDLGLSFAPVQETALRAAGEAMDFGQLFLGMSFFLVVSGLVLTGLLFAFGIQQRRGEAGLLMATGYRPGQVRRLFMQESFLVAVVGSLAGACFGTYYTRVLLWGLGNYWQGAMANSSIQYHAEPATIMTGAAMSFVCAMVALFIAMRRQLSRSARELLAGNFAQDAGSGLFRKSRRLGGLFISLSGILLAAVIIARGLLEGSHSMVGTFFAAGALLLVSCIGLIRLLLIRFERLKGALSLTGLGIRNTGRMRGRNLTVAALLACGCFMVFAVSSMQEDVGLNAGKRFSGTGGFALFGESTFPIQADLDSAEGRKQARLDRDDLMKAVSIVRIKVKDGDDASCLNLNRAQSPRLLGIDPGQFLQRNAFMPENSTNGLWELLGKPLPEGIIPGLAGDSDTAVWGLKRKVGPDGDILEYKDEWGQIFRVKLVGKLPMRLSVFQGNVLIPASAFAEKFPSESGYRMFLVDVSSGMGGQVREYLVDRLSKFGVDMVRPVDRLKEFYAVESTYMLMFLVLGGLGLLLGSVGMGVVVLRNIHERRRELALLKAVGYTDSQVRGVVLVEYWMVLVLGLLAGIISSLAAMLPGFLSSGAGLPYSVMVSFLAGIIIFYLLWIVVSVCVSLSTPLIPALREE